MCQKSAKKAKKESHLKDSIVLRFLGDVSIGYLRLVFYWTFKEPLRCLISFHRFSIDHIVYFLKAFYFHFELDHFYQYSVCTYASILNGYFDNLSNIVFRVVWARLKTSTKPLKLGTGRQGFQMQAVIEWNITSCTFNGDWML